MNFDDIEFDDLAVLINKFDDRMFWKELSDKDGSIKAFNELVSKVKESQDWPKNRNSEKGRLLEELAVFVYERFQDVKVTKNYRPADNETDIEVEMTEKKSPDFITEYIGPKIICECKNYKSKSIDVGVIAKLAELTPKRGARFGVFFSILGVGGYEWRYGEGKRKKILLKDQIPLISFKLSELEKLQDGLNFYTLIKQKVRALFDEVDDESPDSPPKGHREYSKRMLEIVSHFEKCGIITHDENLDITTRIVTRYGIVDNG